MRELGIFFVVFIYVFMILVICMVVWGFMRIFVLGDNFCVLIVDFIVVGVLKYIGLVGVVFVVFMVCIFLLGCVVLIGVEVIFNGVLFFCELKLKNVVMMLVMFGGIVVLMFMGIFVLVSVIGVKMFDEMGELYFVDMYGYVVKE